jgi:uncharacterized membrane protein YedE/YeeE
MHIPILVVGVALAVVLGFASHRASVCTVRAVAEVMGSRRATMFGSIGRSVLWVWAVAFPSFWLVPAAGVGIAGWPLTATAVLGGFVFGLGAAINRGCAFSTMARLVDGDGRMLAAVVGFAMGVFVFAALVQSHWLLRPAPTAALVSSLQPWSTVLGVVFLIWAFYEAHRLWRSRDAKMRFIDRALAPRYRLSAAALLIGLPGALLFMIHGAFGFTATFDLLIETSLGTRSWPTPARWILLIAVLSGLLLSSIQRGSFSIDWWPRREWLVNGAGGAMMGFGAAVTPGGNDALILYGIPTLSPYALPAYAALVLGIAAGLLLMSHFGIKARVECRNDMFITDTWSRPLPPAPLR